MIVLYGVNGNGVTNFLSILISRWFRKGQLNCYDKDDLSRRSKFFLLSYGLSIIVIVGLCRNKHLLDCYIEYFIGLLIFFSAAVFKSLATKRVAIDISHKYAVPEFDFDVFCESLWFYIAIFVIMTNTWYKIESNWSVVFYYVGVFSSFLFFIDLIAILISRYLKYKK